MSQAKFIVVDAIYSPLAQAEALLSDHAKDVGVSWWILAEIQRYSVFEGGSIIHAATLAIGGQSITQDIKDLLGTPLAEAEHLKRMYGVADRNRCMVDEDIKLPGVGGRNQDVVKKSYLCEIIEARTEEILHADELEHAGCNLRYSGGVILTGGTANLTGIVDLPSDPRSG